MDFDEEKMELINRASASSSLLLGQINNILDSGKISAN